MFIYRVLKYFSSIAVFCCATTSVCYLWKYLHNLRYYKISWKDLLYEMKSDVESFAGNRTKIFLFLSLIALLITSTTIHQIVGIHNLKLKPEGNYCFYIELIDETKARQTLPAQVRVVDETKENSDKTKTVKTYWIEKIFWSDGTYLEVDSHEPAKIGEITDCYNAGKELYARLLNKHAYSPYIEETNNATWFDVAVLVAEILPVVFNMYVLLRKFD